MGVLRLLLALCVVIHHSTPVFGLKMLPGDMAVQSFYVISGFYMSLILTEKYIGKNSSYKLFITNRFLRLYPVYWTVLILSVCSCVVVGLVTSTNYHLQLENYLKTEMSPFALIFLILTNLLIFGQDLVMFLGINSTDGTLFFTSNFYDTQPPLYTFLFIWQAWTLGVELMFYLIAPFILRRGFKFLIGCIILSLALRVFLFYKLGLQHDPWTYRFFPTELVFFLFGNLSYRVYAKVKNTNRGNTLGLIMFFAVLLFTLIYGSIPTEILPPFPKRLVYYGVIVVSLPLLFKVFKKNKIDSEIGELSYPVYISHMLIVLVIWHLNPLRSLREGVIVAILSILISILLNKFIAKPIERLRQSRLRKMDKPIKVKVQEGDSVVSPVQ